MIVLNGYSTEQPRTEQTDPAHSHPSYTGSMSSMTCNTCYVTFSAVDEQKNHYRTEWHRHNLKRKVAFLNPITLNEFNERMQTLLSQEEDSRDVYTDCPICKKTFGNQQSYEQHIRSQFHREQQLIQEQINIDLKNETTISIQIEEAEKKKVLEDRIQKAKERSITKCLFCNREQNSLQENVNHMAETHGFFIPDLEYLCDLEKFIEYLKDKIFIEYTCLWCDGKGKSFHSAGAAQTHMIDKSHCRILYETSEDWEQYADFYDFNPLIKELNCKRKNSQEGQEDEDEYEDNSGDENENNNLNRVKGAKPTIGLDPSQREGFKLMLKNGKELVHSDLKVYSKQKLRPNDNRAPIICSLIESYEKIGGNEFNSSQSYALSLSHRALAQQQRERVEKKTKMEIKNNAVGRRRYVNATLRWT
eukprot:c20566_g1_i6.p1 GENE.c20566_g1_i6~~c20566_g1_i6.p1  ORF type:complete len:418 (+),score=159.17 c20566_g1_i6:70-1323(+)